MWKVSLALALAACQLVNAAGTPPAATAWFTDAAIDGGVAIERPANPLAAAPGSRGQGVDLAREVGIENPLLKQDAGMIGFWIQPKWNGDDGKNHRLLRIGDPERNGLLIEKSDKGMLRFVMASPQKTTATRADVSDWKAGEWHHVVISWFSRENKPVGFVLWIDKATADGPTAAGNTFLDPSTMDDPAVYIGHATAEAVMDELIMRYDLKAEGAYGQPAVVYRDYFRSAPYTKVRITPDALRVPSDRRVVKGYEKQFGMLAEKAGAYEYVTDFQVRYGPWAEFDAKPFITWETSDPAVATVNANGRVTGQSLGSCTLKATYLGMSDTYPIEVISPEQPDLDLLYVEMLPRYLAEAPKSWHAVGDPITFVVHLANFGYRDAPAGTVVKFELLPDLNRNYRLDPEEKAITVEKAIVADVLKPRDEATVEFKWTWTEQPTWIRVTLDPENTVSEICEANNTRCDISDARPMEYGYEVWRLEDHYGNPNGKTDDPPARKINHIGSFSFYDWIQGQVERFNELLADQVWPTTTPNGIEMRVRNDNVYKWVDGLQWFEQPWELEKDYYDGGFPVCEPVNLMAIDAAILHEFGHTNAALPDLYGYSVRSECVYLKDENGRPYVDGDLLTQVNRYGDLMFSSASAITQSGVGYDCLMNSCHMWIHPAHAGQVQFFRGVRRPPFWDIQGRLIPPLKQSLQIFDINDAPLTNAAVYVYHVTNTDAQCSVSKFFADLPKFYGHTDEGGRFAFPERTSDVWDDPDTDINEAWEDRDAPNNGDRKLAGVPVWNPFGGAQTSQGTQPDVAFTPNCYTVEGLLLVKIVTDKQTEFVTVPLTEFNRLFFEGQKVRALLPLRTSLLPSDSKPAIQLPDIPDAVKERNLRPVAKTADRVEVRVGEQFSLDGGESYDPEGQPLYYYWDVQTGDAEPRGMHRGAVFRGKITREGEHTFRFWVTDGVRVSFSKEVKVIAVPASADEPSTARR